MTTRSSAREITSGTTEPSSPMHDRSFARVVASGHTIQRSVKMAAVAIAFGLVSSLVACSSNSPTASDGIDYVPSGAVSGTDASTTQRCSGSKTECGDQCVELSAAPAHCGSCDNVCAAGQTCESGVCKVSAANCATGTVDCGGTCVDVTSDKANCGTCTNACGDNQMCLAGACTVGCAAGSVQCGAACVDPISSHTHCGATPGCGVSGAGSAGVTCGPQDECIGGSCYSQCTGATLSCGSDCVDPDTDNNNCGSCGHQCGTGQACSVGQCCAANETACQGACRDLTSNHDSCGGCGIVCETSQTCVNSQCVAQ